ncbi:aldehyde oxidase, partial [bacterium]
EHSMDDDAPKIHTDNEFAKIPTKYEPDKNLAAEVEIKFGDMDKGFAEADFIVENTYSIHYASHCAIEPHTSIAYFDERKRLVIITATQVPFHARRITSQLIGIPIRDIRVIKPRIGGGFGGKQENLLEPLVALVANRNRRPAKLKLSRKEVFISSRTRHPMRTRLKAGVKNDGTITALEMDGLMNAGAYGSHALTVLSNAGSKVLPLFNKIENIHFIGRSVYTNLPVGGAYRGYGATQGYAALNQHIDIIARKLGVDVLEYIKKWHIREGETSPVFEALGEGKEGTAQIIHSCKLDECIDRGAEAIGWYEKRGKKIREGSKVRGVGVAVAMQGSGIPRVDMGSAYIKMNEDGSFNLSMGATDIGTGSDTILTQIAAEVLSVPVEKFIVRSSDTDLTPFDVGAYASSTTYVSGNAVRKCAEEIAKQIIDVGAKLLDTNPENLTLENGDVVDTRTGKKVSFERIGYYTFYENDQFQIQAGGSFCGTESPPPFIAQFADVVVDTETGRVDVLKFVSAVDCGQAINPKLAEGQVEGATVNGINYALWEEYKFDKNGRMTNPNFTDYKLLTAADIPELITIIVNSFEETGPFGAKSIAEIGINGPIPAIANAIYDAVGVRLFHSPFTPEKVLKALKS